VTARIRILAVLLACLSLVATGCGDKGAGGKTVKNSTAASGPCKYLDSGQPAARKVSKPPAEPAATGQVKVTIKTNFGDAALTLDAGNAPCAVNSFLSLSRQHYYDKTSCTRVSYDSRGFAILQCGDPSGTGAGDPGYRYAEEVTGKEKYRSGMVAMAKETAPATSGSQFFVMLGDTQLPPQYTVLGQLSATGLAVFRKAGQAALAGKTDGYDGPPATKVEITGVTRP
jgi:peptidyl-prolyl cis-trans isomerase B (cyclophilin B)